MKLDAQPLKLRTDISESSERVGFGECHHQEVVHITSNEWLPWSDRSSGASIFNELIGAMASGPNEHICNGRMDGPQCPAPSHGDAAEAVKNNVIWKYLHELTILPNLGDSSI